MILDLLNHQVIVCTPCNLILIKSYSIKKLSCETKIGILLGRFALYPDGLKPLIWDGLRGLGGGSIGPLSSLSTIKRTNLGLSLSNCTASSCDASRMSTPLIYFKKNILVRKIWYLTKKNKQKLWQNLSYHCDSISNR